MVKPKSDIVDGKAVRNIKKDEMICVEIHPTNEYRKLKDKPIEKRREKWTEK